VAFYYHPRVHLSFSFFPFFLSMIIRNKLFSLLHFMRCSYQLKAKRSITRCPLTGRNSTGPPPDKYACHGVLQTTVQTTDNDRRQRASLVWPPYLMCKRASNKSQLPLTGPRHALPCAHCVEHKDERSSPVYHTERPRKLTTLAMVDTQLRNFSKSGSLGQISIEGSTLIFEDTRIPFQYNEG